MTPSRHEVILAGSGGQGLVVSGILLAEAAILEGKNVVQTVSYGIASRGGFSMAEVIIDSGEIIFQQVQDADVVLVLTGEAMEKLPSLAGPGTSVFYDTTLVQPQGDGRWHGFPFTAMAAEIGHAGAANTIALGCVAASTGMVSPDSLARVIRRRFSGKICDVNLEALNEGVRLAAGLNLPPHREQQPPPGKAAHPEEAP